MKLTIFIFASAVLMAADGAPQFTPEGKMLRPGDYREWVFLSSGLGMTYGTPNAGGEPMFDNVFVNRAAYDGFLKTGTWPDKTVMVLEVRGSESKGSINNGGHYQAGVHAIEVHVKDEKRFPGKWAFFGFPQGETASKMIPTTERCYSCHSEHGAVDTTFVQFYPTLIDIAKQKGTYK
jgi:hypothetical protein